MARTIIEFPVDGYGRTLIVVRQIRLSSIERNGVFII